MSYYLYILYSDSSDIYYIGITNNYKNRLFSHNNSDRITFTSKHRPWKLVAVFKVATRSEAIHLEKFIKNQKSKKLIERLIDPTFNLIGKLAQLVRVPYVRD